MDTTPRSGRTHLIVESCLRCHHGVHSVRLYIEIVFSVRRNRNQRTVFTINVMREAKKTPNDGVHIYASALIRFHIHFGQCAALGWNPPFSVRSGLSEDHHTELWTFTQLETTRSLYAILHREHGGREKEDIVSKVPKSRASDSSAQSIRAASNVAMVEP